MHGSRLHPVLTAHAEHQESFLNGFVFRLVGHQLRCLRHVNGKLDQDFEY